MEKIDASGEKDEGLFVWGMISSALGGFYYVQNGDTLLECRARGLFRKQDISPLVGDHVRVRITGAETGQVEELMPRKNSLTRPPVANLDVLCMVVSIASPAPNLLVMDKMLAIAEHKGIEPILAVTKADLEEAACARLCSLYAEAGFRVFPVCALTGRGIDALTDYLRGKLSCLCGNTGAGKSSLCNVIDPGLTLKTDVISQKLGRGKHTTRHVQLYPMQGGGFIADTPGFSALEISRYEVIFKEDLPDCFREFGPYQQNCRYTGCSHTSEDGCAVLEAAREGKIAPSRLESYKAMYKQAQQIKKWELVEKCGK